MFWDRVVGVGEHESSIGFLIQFEISGFRDEKVENSDFLEMVNFGD
jgi:hypothetical protein